MITRKVYVILSENKRIIMNENDYYTSLDDNDSLKRPYGQSAGAYPDNTYSGDVFSGDTYFSDADSKKYYEVQKIPVRSEVLRRPELRDMRRLIRVLGVLVFGMSIFDYYLISKAKDIVYEYPEFVPKYNLMLCLLIAVVILEVLFQIWAHELIAICGVVAAGVMMYVSLRYFVNVIGSVGIVSMVTMALHYNNALEVTRKYKKIVAQLS